MSTVDLEYSPAEAASHLNVAPETLERLNRRFAPLLSDEAVAESASYNSADVAALLTVQKLMQQGYTDEQISLFLTPIPAEIETESSLAVSMDGDLGDDAIAPSETLPTAAGDLLNTIANSQKTILNSQSAIRDLIGAILQDNFNLKDENRKLRERMLEMERSLAEYQRREETRKERMESRMRALEGTLGALQQQVAQLVQLQRQSQKRRRWF